MKFINMTSTGKATIEVDVREFNRMVLDCNKLNLLECGGVNNWDGYDESLDYINISIIDGECYHGFEAYKKQMEQANNFKE